MGCIGVSRCVSQAKSVSNEISPMAYCRYFDFYCHYQAARRHMAKTETTAAVGEGLGRVCIGNTRNGRMRSGPKSCHALLSYPRRFITQFRKQPMARMSAASALSSPAVVSRTERLGLPRIWSKPRRITGKIKKRLARLLYARICNDQQNSLLHHLHSN